MSFHVRILLVLMAALLPGSLALRGAEPGEKKKTTPARTDCYGDPLPEGAIARLGTVRFRHGSNLQSVAFSPDGKTLLSGGGDGALRFWDAATGRELFHLQDKGIFGTAAVFSPDGKMAASAIYSSPVQLWDLTTRKAIRQFALPQLETFCRTFSPDGKFLPTVQASWMANSMRSISFWEVATGKKSFEIAAHEGSIHSLDFSPDGKLLASAGADPMIRLWDLATRKLVREFAGSKEFVGLVAFSPDGKWLASTETEKRWDKNEADYKAVHLWDAATGKEIRKFSIHEGTVNYIAFAPDGKTLAAGCSYADSMLYLWDLATGKMIYSIKGNNKKSYQVVFSPDGKTLAVWSGWGIRFLETATGKEITPFQGHQGWITQMAFSPDDRYLATIDQDGVEYTTCLWDVDRGTMIWHLRGRFLAFSPDGKTLAIARDPQAKLIHLLESSTGREMRQLQGHRSMVLRAAFSPDGKVLVSGGSDDSIRLWDPFTAKQTGESRFNTTTDVLAFSPDGDYLVAGVIGSLLLFSWKNISQAENFSYESAWETHGNGLTSLTFTPDGKSLISTGHPNRGDATVRVWELATGKERMALGKDEDSIDSAVLLPDGRTLAGGHYRKERKSVSGNRAIGLWDIATGKKFGILPGHAGGKVSALALSTNGRMMALGSTDTTILIWDVATLGKERKKTVLEMDPRKLTALWDDLASDDAAKAFQAMWTLIEGGDRSLPFLKERLLPHPPADVQRLARLIADLDADSYPVRAKASEELEKMGRAAVPTLRQVLKSKPCLEVRRRVELLLEKLAPEEADEQELSPALLQSLRAIEVLEAIGSEEARRLLDDMAKVAVRHRVSEEARAALERLSRRDAARP